MEKLVVALILAIIGGFFIGAAPVVRIAALDANQCQHVSITKYWGAITIIDTVMCEGQTFTFNGEELNKFNDRELINDVQE
jgi:hypothetical protein